MNQEAQRLYELLPSLYRIQDAEQGEPLKAYLSIIAEEIFLLRDNIEQLYDDQFIETCADWVVPYIGDLIGYQPLHGETSKTGSSRAEVANTIAYRRRKGTASVLEQLARDVTGWNARVVEFFQLLNTTQYMNHIRPNNCYSPDLRKWEPLERLNSAFDSIAHTVDVRRIDRQKGRFNIRNIGIFLWRLDAFRLTRSPAFRVDDRRFMFSPLGNNVQLYTRPQTEDEITHLAEPLNVPDPIGRRILQEYLENYYGTGLSLLLESKDDGKDKEAEIISNIKVCDLSDSNDGSWLNMPKPGGKITLDPVLGRIAFPDAQPVNRNILATYHYGFSAMLGGGEYQRQKSFLINTVPDQSLSYGGSIHPALDAVKKDGLLQIEDSCHYHDDGTALKINTNSKIEIRADNRKRPMLSLSKDWEITLDAGAELTLNGLLITGASLRVLAGKGEGSRTLRLRHCTLVPGIALERNGDPVSPEEPSLIVEDPAVRLEVDHCIIGGVRCRPEVDVAISNSIIDATEKTNVAFANIDHESAGGSLTIQNATIVGKVHTRRMELISNTIFYSAIAKEKDPWKEIVKAPIRVEQKQDGCVRFSYVPLEAIVPRRYHCQPDKSIADAVRSAEKEKLSADKKDGIKSDVCARIRPAFNSTRYGDSGYMQLASFPEVIRIGADDESEMGAFHDLFAPQRETNLRLRLEEYLRFGLEAGVFYST